MRRGWRGSKPWRRTPGLVGMAFTRASDSLMAALSPGRWFWKMRCLAAAYASSEGYRSRWSGVTFSTVAEAQRRETMDSSWKLDSSQTVASSRSPASTRLLSALPRFPPVKTRRPAAASRCPQSAVVVLLPLVPVIPSSGSSMRREASSTSPITSRSRERASAKIASESGTPGLTTTRSMPRSESGTTRRNSPSKETSSSSAAITCAPPDRSSRAAAAPLFPRPTTRACRPARFIAA